LDVGCPVLGLLEARESNRPRIVVGDEHRTGCEVVEDVPPLLLPRLGDEALRRGNLCLELLPELAQDRLVGLGCAADLHDGAVRSPVRR